MGRLVRKPTAIKLNLDRMIKDADRYDAKVGWFAGKSYPHNGPEVWRVASWMELGVESRSIPPRPMFGPTFARETPNWQKTMAQMSSKIVKGQMDIKQAFDYLGMLAVGDTQKTISNIHEPALSPLTILLRKWQLDHSYAPTTGKIIGQVVKDKTADVSGISVKPLVWTGLLYATITNITDEK